jgi:NAD(P)-dependent dehydrogenase (short-subunit alcohol dehydrogenase family)
MHGIADRVALITGAGSGIGQASAKRFAEEGANVVVVDIDEEAGKSTVESIVNQGGDATFVAADVSDPAQVEAMVDTAIDTYGKLDFAHNNAGFTVDRQPLHETHEKYWDDINNVYLKGVWLGLKYEIPAMIKTGGGAVVNTASGSGLEGEAGLSSYSAAKHGVVGLTKTAALEYAQQDIRVNAVCPGPIKTPKLLKYEDEDPEMLEEFAETVPMNRFGTPKEIASAVVWLCSTDASFVTGHSLPVDGGILAG